jgi:hypothetical protein
LPINVKITAAEIAMTPSTKKRYGGLKSEFKSHNNIVPFWMPGETFNA